jgi:hypothetical protein
MKLVEINWNPSNRQLRQFGFTCLILLPLIGWFWNASTTVIGVLFTAGAIIVALSYLMPTAAKGLFLGLILLTAPLGMIVGELAMLAIYFFIFVPIAVGFRLIGRDALQRKIDKSAGSYWQAKREPTDVSSYYRRY